MNAIFQLSVLVPCLLLAARTLAGQPTTQPIVGPVDQPFMLHLPGIGGHRLPDEMLRRGLLAGGFDAEIYIYDWTGEDEGLLALTNEARHEAQATIVAAQIEAVARRQPGRRIILSSHSAGAGIAAWALARLPADVKIDTWLILAPALSPDFDLSQSLRHVNRAYHFYSSIDPVLGFGTRNFGTVDRVKTDSAGKVGFRRPPGGDAQQYAKLRQFPYQIAWLRLGNAGDHIGATMLPFARGMLAPLLLTGELPKLAPLTTAPSVEN